MKESDVVRQILDYLAAERIFAFRLNTAAFSGEHNGKQRFFRAHGLGPGAADILALPNKLEKFTNNSGSITRCVAFVVTPLWIECKNETGKQSPLQKSFQQYVEGLGHRYILARSVDDVKIGECAGGGAPR